MTGDVRAFLALPLSDEQRREIDEKIETVRRMGEPVRWVPPENLHVTFRFFGDVDRGLLEEIVRRVEPVAARSAPFPCALGAAGAFPDLRAPRVLWVGLGEGGGEVTALARRVEDAIDGLGFRRERRFHSHITVGRAKGRLSGRFRERFERLAFEPAAARSSSIDLMKSRLTPQGAIYESLRSIPLGR